MQKREAHAPSGTRIKTCERCGRTFELSPAEKFYLCRDCYAADLRRLQERRKRATTVLSRIHCPECGAEEYLDFLPPDPGEALCRACFARRRREQKAKIAHPHA